MYIVACRSFARRQPRNKQPYNSHYKVMALQTTVVAVQWLSSDHVSTSTHERNSYTAAGERCFLCGPYQDVVKQDKFIRGWLVSHHAI
jgi:hypothetical protein